MWATYTGDAHYLANNSNSVYIQVAKNDPGHAADRVGYGAQGRSGTHVPRGPDVPVRGRQGQVLRRHQRRLRGQDRFGDGLPGRGQRPTTSRATPPLPPSATPLVPGKNSIYASYGGDSDQGSYSEFNPSTSNVVHRYRRFLRGLAVGLATCLAPHGAHRPGSGRGGPARGEEKAAQFLASLSTRAWRRGCSGGTRRPWA